MDAILYRDEMFFLSLSQKQQTSIELAGLKQELCIMMEVDSTGALRRSPYIFLNA